MLNRQRNVTGTDTASSDLGPPTAPKVSVCLLVFNHGKVLAETVASVLNQTEQNFELLLSDDCSRDDSWQIIQDLAVRDPRIRPLRTPRNLGMAGNANFSAAEARGEFIALLHHDDLYVPTLLERWLDVATRHPSVGFVSNAYGFVGSDEQKVDYHPFRECHPGREALESIFFPRWGCPVRGTALIRTSAWRSLNGMRERFGLLADVDLWMRLAARWDVGYVREPLIRVRHARPDDYPDEYVSWSWERSRLLYEIHGTNRAEYFADNRPAQRRALAVYRLRVSVDELRWLTYAVVKRRWRMLDNCHLVANSYELPPVRASRALLQSLARR
jgi:glycosyltransferase involved in cell wall biosynthesis